MISYVVIFAVFCALALLYKLFGIYIQKYIALVLGVQIAGERKVTDTTNKIIVTFKGSSYDVTSFIKFHPGGKKVLMDNNGNDVEALMLKHKHSIHAYDTMKKYKIN
jgi:hypothetical protein